MATKADVLEAVSLLQGASGEFLDREEVATLLKVSLRTVDGYIAKGLLQPLRIKRSRLVRFRRQDVLDLLQPIVKK